MLQGGCDEEEEVISWRNKLDSVCRMDEEREMTEKQERKYEREEKENSGESRREKRKTEMYRGNERGRETAD